MIERFYTNSASVQRLTYSGNKGTYGVAATVMGHLQQASPFVQAQTASMYTISHLFWCAIGSNIGVNDNVVISGATYSVKGIQTNNYGLNNHLEVHLEKL
jgi:hypothetical protein